MNQLRHQSPSQTESNGGTRTDGIESPARDVESAPPKPGWKARVTRELEEVGLVTLYFLICFGIILMLKKLMLADYQIQIYALSTTVIGALIAAKVVVLLEKTPVGTRFDRGYPIGVGVLYKTTLYTIVVLAVLFAENLFDAYRSTKQFDGAVAYVWAHRDKDATFVKLICVALAFIGYHLYAALDRHLGEGTLRRLVWTRRREPE